MTRPYDQAVLEALTELNEATFSELYNHTGLSAPNLEATLYRLTGLGKVRRLSGGRYRATNRQHSRSVKRGLLVKSIPSIGEGR